MAYTPEQHEAIFDRSPRICVSAGAGSGKTRVLVERMVSLLEEDQQLDLAAVAAITFTDKAAAEMKARLRAEFRRRVAASLGDPAAVSRWRGLERRLDSGRISTIHSFCLNLLRQHALRLGLDPDFALIAEADAALLAQDAVRATLHALLDAGDAAALRLCTAFELRNAQSMLLELLQHRTQLTPLLPKPNADLASLAAAHEDLLHSEHALYFECCRRGWRARRLLMLLHRLEGLCVNADDGREVRRRNFVAAFAALVDGVDASAVKTLLQHAVEHRPRGSRKHWPEEEYKSLEKLQKQCDDFATSLLSAGEIHPQLDHETAQTTCDLVAVFAHVDDAYAAAKRRLNVLDFEDAIQMAEAALRMDASLCEEVASGLRHLLVDEFQDTDRVQLAIAERLAACRPGPTLFVVGDAKQSIYAFRGAEVSVFLDAQRQASKVIPLAKNFRTRRAVLDFINHVFEVTGLVASVEQYAAMETGREEPGGEVEFLIHEKTGKAELCREAEADLIAGRIAELLLDGGERPVAAEDIAILVRRTTSLSPYEEALRRLGIPYRIGAGSGFYRLQEVLDVMNCCRVVLDPWDEAALLAFLRSPLAGLSDDALVLMTEHLPLSTAFAGAFGDALPDAEVEKLRRARTLIAELRRRQHEPVAAFLQYLMEATGLEAILLGLHHGVQKAANLRKLVEIAEEFSARRPISLHGFIEYVEGVRAGRLREGEAPLATEGAGAVTILTVHKAKGLEFPIVIIAGAGEKHRGRKESALYVHRDVAVAAKPESDDAKCQPSVVRAIRLRSEAEELAEFGRLFYVALTRARDRLIIASGPQPAKESWFESLDLLFNVCGAEHGTTVPYPGGTITVRRYVKADRRAGERPQVPVPDRTVLEGRLVPLLPTISSGAALSVSVILDHLAQGIDPEEERGAEARGNFSREALSAIARGRRVHRLMECWDMQGDAPVEEVLREAALPQEEHPAAREDLAACTSRVRALEAWPELKRIRREDREIPFLLAVKGGYISGVIDAITPEGTLVDYKTGRFDEQRHARYSWQLLLYAAAVRALRGMAPREGLVVYVDEGRCERVSLDAEAIDHALRDTAIIHQQLCAGTRQG